MLGCALARRQAGRSGSAADLGPIVEYAKINEVDRTDDVRRCFYLYLVLERARESRLLS